ncbi:MAG: Nramp family divalent metal transporter [Candidatus Velthaea sp.]
MLGPAFVVSIGYMDPGNWATDLAGGAYGYRLLWVIVLANAMAIVLQLAVTHVTVATGTSLATLIAKRWPKRSTSFWVVFQGAAIATDLAEFSGIVLGVQLLLHCSLLASVALGLFLVVALLATTSRAPKALEYSLIGIVGLIGLAFLYQVPLLHPSIAAIWTGSTVPVIPDGSALVIIVGIIGATVMPHNLFLHSSLVLKNCAGHTLEERRRSGKFFAKETLIALNVAAAINAAIMIVGASLHGADGSIEKAFSSLAPLAGGSAATVFGAALLLSGLAASTTATVSGDYIFQSFSPVKVSPVLRRGITLVPAAIALSCGIGATSLLIWSQVILALVLPVALIPLVLIMRGMESPGSRRYTEILIGAAAVVSMLCIGFDGVMLIQTLH